MCPSSGYRLRDWTTGRVCGVLDGLLCGRPDALLPDSRSDRLHDRAGRLFATQDVRLDNRTHDSLLDGRSECLNACLHACYIRLRDRCRGSLPGCLDARPNGRLNAGLVDGKYPGDGLIDIVSLSDVFGNEGEPDDGVVHRIRDCTHDHLLELVREQPRGRINARPRYCLLNHLLHLWRVIVSQRLNSGLNTRMRDRLRKYSRDYRLGRANACFRNHLNASQNPDLGTRGDLACAATAHYRPASGAVVDSRVSGHGDARARGNADGRGPEKRQPDDSVGRQTRIVRIDILPGLK